MKIPKCLMFWVVVGFILLAGGLRGNAYTVMNTNDTGAGSLRWAITQANTTIGADVIDFNIPGTGVQTIYPLSQLPPLYDTAGVFIDGLTQPGASMGTNPPSSCTLMVEVNGAQAGASHGFWVVSPNNTIQGLVVDSFQQHGIRIQGTPNGTYNNGVFFNFIGIDPSGTTVRGNGWNHNRYWGGVYIEVATDSIGYAYDNTVQDNLISGNYAEGVGISSCPPGDVYDNYVFDNYIGTAYSGSSDRGNIHDGVYIGEGAHDNIVDGNIISGNDFEGVCIIGYPPYGWDSHDNTIFNNIIGLDINLNSLPNLMDGVSIGQYGNIYQGGFATNNIIDNNTIAFNGRNGIMVWEHDSSTTNADGNQITQNSIYNNQSLGIDLGDDGITQNDPGDLDSGPNEEVNFPVITGAYYNAGQTTVSGTLDIDTSPIQSLIEVFKAIPDPSTYGEGEIFLGATNPDGAGNWQVVVTGINSGDYVTATTTDMNFNTSEFSQNFVVVSGVEESKGTENPTGYALHQNYPNPFSLSTSIQFDLPKASLGSLKIYDVSGKLVKILDEGVSNTSHRNIYWNGDNENGERMASGVYFYRLETEKFTATKKLILKR